MTEKNHGHLVCIASSAGLIGVNGLAGNSDFTQKKKTPVQWLIAALRGMKPNEQTVAL